MKFRQWSKGESNFLNVNYAKMELIDLQFHLSAINPNFRRSLAAIRGKANKLGVLRKFYTLEEKRYILQNYRKLSGAQIAAKLGIKPKSFTAYCNKFLGIKFREKQTLKPNHAQITKRLARIIGNLMGDGHISSKSYIVTYTNFSEKRVKKFKEDIYLQFGIKMREVRKYKNQSCFVVEIGNKEMVSFFSTIFDKFNHKEIMIPQFILEGSKKLKAAFLQAIFSDDGHVTFIRVPNGFRGQIGLTLANKNLIYAIGDMLNNTFGITCRIRLNPNNTFVLMIKKNQSVFKFYQYINFQSESLVSRKNSIFYGKPKNHVLEKLISYKNSLH